MYRHVDILNDYDLNAHIVHGKKGFVLSWFMHSTKVVDCERFKEIYQPESDIIVVPEDWGHKINNIPGKKVIFNQGCYNGFNAYAFKEPSPYPYLRKDVLGVMTVSDHNTKYLNFAYPKLNTQRIYQSINSSIFSFRDISQKKRKISCVPSKNCADLFQLYHIIKSRAQQGLNQVNEYEWVFIKDKPEKEIAEIFRDSLVFVFLSTREGLPLMPLEAMLSGCVVLGYCQGPLVEYLRPENSFNTDILDIASLVTNLEKITGLFLENPENLRSINETAYKTAREFLPEREAESVLHFWRDILKK